MMFIEALTKARKSFCWRRAVMLAAFLCAAAIYPAKSEAQIIGDLEADIPFQFHAGNAKLPAGRYTIHRLDDSDEAVLEITSADGRVSALFGSQVIESRYEKKVSQTSVNSQEHVSARRRARQGN